ncbi:sugar phosphate isomerase/epimerase family protein [Aquipuribacter sp. SD81]|uniref:sugar phosphate isomerase/epimerase family protein n=1 Tax=Aquipuribacter sp. SD81 TaxID=3127703 RepID=UPI0030188F2F
MAARREPAPPTHASTLVDRFRLSRRSLLAAGTGLAAGFAAAGLGGPAAAAPPGGSPANGVLVPAPKRGIILYTVRDAISRDPLSTDAPSGFREVLEHLSDLGYRQIELAGFRQHANSEGGSNLDSLEGAALLRSWLDDNGLVAEGNHGSVPNAITPEAMAAFDEDCQIASVLGLGHIGTGNDPTRNRQKPAWDAAAEVWNHYGEHAMTQYGLKLYTHNHDQAYNFLLDEAPDATGAYTASSGLRQLEYFLSITDPRYVWLEMDIYWAHVAQYKYPTYTAADGSTVTRPFDPAGLVAQHTQRYPLFHAKDGASMPGTTNGYSMVPFGTGDIDYSEFFRRVGAKGYHNPMYEQDNAAQIGDGSLANAAISIENMAALRG